MPSVSGRQVFAETRVVVGRDRILANTKKDIVAILMRDTVTPEKE